MGGFVTEYFIDGRWIVTPYTKTKKEAAAEVETPPRLVKAEAARVRRRNDGKVVLQVRYV